jgi:hypothetical protein
MATMPELIQAFKNHETIAPPLQLAMASPAIPYHKEYPSNPEARGSVSIQTNGIKVSAIDLIGKIIV